MNARCRGERGDAGPLEAVILMPAVLAAFALIMVLGRGQGADNSVEHAAKAAARAAASAQTEHGAQSRAEAAAVGALANSPCSGPHVAVSGSWAAGGRVYATVTCSADLSDMTRFIGVPARKAMSATASEPVDTIRGGD